MTLLDLFYSLIPLLLALAVAVLRLNRTRNERGGVTEGLHHSGSSMKRGSPSKAVPTWQRALAGVLAIGGAVSIVCFWASVLSTQGLPSWSSLLVVGVVAPYGCFLFASVAIHGALPRYGRKNDA
jgi:hypothetical protein